MHQNRLVPRCRDMLKIEGGAFLFTLAPADRGSDLLVRRVACLRRSSDPTPSLGNRTAFGELDEAMKSARASKSGAYIEIIGGKMDMPPALAFAHGQLKAMYGDTP